ncbi:MAG TPA: TonB-dependent receptor, partial [Cyclobacteriaceae bacterium]|nr:TonB-dependent receptor [Cyclobacteriaceae bacterium]
MSSYTSRDRFSLASDTLNQWQNATASVLYERTISEQLFATATLAFGRYSYDVTDDDPATAFDLHYGITYPSLKIDLNRNSLFHNQTFGFQTTYYVFKPGDLESRSPESAAVTTHMPAEKAFESAFYFSDNFQYTDRLQIEAGLRLSIFNRIGPGRVYHYLAEEPLEPQNIIDSTMYGSGDVMKTFVRPEPRLSLNYIIDLQSSFKLGFNRIYQYVHLITNSATVTPVDIWQLSNTYFQPQRADQISAGYFRTSRNHRFEMVVESYYKYQKNILEFKDGANLILNPQLETDLLSGTGRSYGAEFSLRKLTGKLQGTLSYSYSRSLRRAAGNADVEIINDGQWFPSNADQPHVVNLSWNFNVTRRVFFTGNFLYHTGRPVSLPSGGYIVNGIVIPDFEARNNYRIPDYHRLDIAFVIEGSNRKDRKFESSWIFSLYNVYGRKNPYSVFFAHLGGGVVK